MIANALNAIVSPGGKNQKKRLALAATVTVKQIAADTGIPESTVGDSDSWKAFHAERSGTTLKKPIPKSDRSLTSKMLASRPDQSAVTPLTQLLQRETEARYRSLCSFEELAHFEAATPNERSQLLALFAEQLDNDD